MVELETGFAGPSWERTGWPPCRDLDRTPTGDWCPGVPVTNPPRWCLFWPAALMMAPCTALTFPSSRLKLTFFPEPQLCSARADRKWPCTPAWWGALSPTIEARKKGAVHLEARLDSGRGWFARNGRKRERVALQEPAILPHWAPRCGSVSRSAPLAQTLGFALFSTRQRELAEQRQGLHHGRLELK